MDDSNLPELTRRQEEILSLIIRTYTDTPQPVSSQFLTEHSQLNVSSATVRNEMAVLEKLGYIAAPHASAGRVPTENGYRYFVKRLITTSTLAPREQQHIAEKFQVLPMATEQWLRQAASTLSRLSSSASLVTPPSAETSRFKHLELVSVQGRLVLMVLVLHGGAVHQRMMTMPDPLSQAKLSEVATRLSNLFLDLTLNELRMRGVGLPLLERDITETVVDLMERADTQQMRIVYRDGLSEVISAFHDSEGAQQAVRVFEERAFLSMILSEFLNPLTNQVEVIIAGEGRWEEVSRLSFVLSRYGQPGKLSGAIGVLGPTHINYGRAIGAVRHVSAIMTDLVAKLYDSPEGDPPVRAENDTN